MQTETNKDSESVQAAYEKALAYLKQQEKEGFWSYFAGKQAALEPSCWAAIALRRNRELLARFVSRLLSSQNIDGGWSNEPFRLESDWSTAAGLFALSFLAMKNKKEGLGLDNLDSRLGSAIERAQLWLLENRAERFSNAARFALLLWKGPEHDYKRGWPWTLDTFDWVEPTAYALLSLKYRATAPDLKLKNAIEMARGYLLDIACPDGGWNFGDRNPLNSNYNKADLMSTSIVLLALHGSLEGPVLRKAIDCLHANVSESEGQTAGRLAWSCLALITHGKECGKLLSKLQDFQDESGAFSTNLLSHSIALLSFEPANEPGSIF